MAFLGISGSERGNALQAMLAGADIAPGDDPSYQLCKTLYAYHPLGAKIVEKPIALAQSKARKIVVGRGDDQVVKQFQQVWRDNTFDAIIFNTMALSRVYGVASVALLVDGQSPADPIKLQDLYKQRFAFNVYDPLNTAGSLVLNQIPLSLDFLKTTGAIAVSGQRFHPSRTNVVMNEQPIYIEYTSSAFGFVGRSVFQRALYLLKSFLQTMITDDCVAVKSGVIVAKLKQAGSIVNAAMLTLFGIKRTMIKEARQFNVLSVADDESIETLNMQNVDGAFGKSRDNILKNIAAACDDMPASLLNQETFAEGFGEGTEDARMVARYVDRMREKMARLYAFFDRICMHLAWTPEFFKALQAQGLYKNCDFDQFFVDCVNSFEAPWPPFLEDPPSEQVKVDDVKLKAMIAVLEVLLPILDPENKAVAIQWLSDLLNDMKLLFTSTLDLDLDAFRGYVPPVQSLDEPRPGHPFAAQDAAMNRFSEAVAAILDDGERAARLPKLVARR